MTNAEGMTNDTMPRKSRRWQFVDSDFVIDSSFVIRHSSFRYHARSPSSSCLVVITIIIVLAGLVLSTVGYVRKKGARSRAEAEIAAMSAACESYKADNGIYPSGIH